MNKEYNEGKPSAREILQAQIRKRAQQNQLIHREFGDFAFSSVLKRHNALVEKIINDQQVSVNEIDELTDRMVTVDISDLDYRNFLRSALSFWDSKLRKKDLINRRPYSQYKEIQPLKIIK